VVIIQKKSNKDNSLQLINADGVAERKITGKRCANNNVWYYTRREFTGTMITLMNDY